MNNLNKLNCLLFLVIFLFQLDFIKSSSTSFFAPRSVTTDSVYELMLVNYDRYHLPYKSSVQFYYKPFFMESTNKSQMARYFLAHNKKCLTINEAGEGDLGSLWFNLISPIGTIYTSKICLSPQRKAFGALLELYVDFMERLWAGIVTTPMHVKHELNFKETDQAQEGTISGISDACDAFNNPSWTAGKIPCEDKRRTGLDDIQLKLGYDFYKTNSSHSTFYLVGTIPTGTRSKSKVMFEPIIGSVHASLGLGFDVDYKVFSCGKHSFNFLMDIKYRYVFAATERRSFDLVKNGDWSRYLLIVPQSQILNSIPAISFLTMPVRVTSGNTIDIYLNLHYQHDKLGIELGYDFWWRQREKIHRKKSLPSGYGIQKLNIYPFTATTASTANISQSINGPNATIDDLIFVQLKNSDLNLNSAEHPSAHSQTVYTALSYRFDMSSCSIFLGFGSTFELGVKNALKQWGVWFSNGITF